MNGLRPASALGRLIRLAAAGLLCAAAAIACADAQDVAGAASLRATYASVRDRLEDTPFQRPITLESRQSAGELRGDIHAVIEHPFAELSAAVGSAETWCDILLLHLNVKHCATTVGQDGRTLTAFVGAKQPQPLRNAHRITFGYRLEARSADYLQVRLAADAGPFGTRDYRIVLAAIPLDAGHSFVHLSYAYGYGAAAAIALRTYFGTAASDKVGFTVVGRRSDGQPMRVGSLRGALERNTMRYFLAIEAYLHSMTAPADTRLEVRLRDWFAATERYATQLHEVEQGEYLAMKREEFRRVYADAGAPAE